MANNTGGADDAAKKVGAEGVSGADATGMDRGADAARPGPVPAEPLRPGDVIFHSAAAVLEPVPEEALAGPGLAGPGLVGSGEESAPDPRHLAEFVEAFGSLPGHLAYPGSMIAEALLVLDVSAAEATDTTNAAAVSAEGTGAPENPDHGGAGGVGVTGTAGTAGAGETAVFGVRLGVMSTEAVANHLPELAPRLSKPKVFYIGGQNEPVVLGIGLLDQDTPGESEQRFGENGEFMFIHTGDGAPDIDEQVAEVVGHVDPSALKGLRLFHSYVTLPGSVVEAWRNHGLVSTAPAAAEDIFASTPGETWRGIMKRRPFPENLLSTWANNPERN